MFPRPTFGLGLSSVLGSREPKTKPATDEEWYIPYNGPYEAPREQPRKSKARDSWGDPLDDDGSGDDEDETRELYKRYGGHNDFSFGKQPLGHGVFDDESLRGRKGSYDREAGKERGRSRSPHPDRTLSVISGRTTSSGAVDPARASVGTTRRSTVSTPNPPPVPSYISLDTRAAGVGESPVPPVRTLKDSNRISLASIFTFGGRRTTESPTRSLERGYSNPSSSSKRSRKTSEKGYSRMESPAPRISNSSSSDNVRFLRQAHQTPVVLATSHHASANKQQQLLQQTKRESSLATEDEDYYNTYYGTLIDRTDRSIDRHPYTTSQALVKPQPTQQEYSPHSVTSQHSLPTSPHHDPYKTNNTDTPVLIGLSRQTTASTTSGHPYGYTIPQPEYDDQDFSEDRIPEPPQSAPILTTPHTPHTPIYRQQPHPYNQVSAPSYSPQPINEQTTNKAPKLTFSVAPASADAANVAFSPRGVGVGSVGLNLTSGGGRTLKGSTSSPDLRLSQIGSPRAAPSPRNYVPPPRFVFPKGVDRWLSAETWCDSMLFPRPRLKLKYDKTIEPSSPGGPVLNLLPSPSSGRIVSPPDSPLGPDFRPGTTTAGGEARVQMTQREPGIASRVLAHSRSLVDLKEKEKISEYPSVMPSGVQFMQDPQSSKMGAASGNQGPQARVKTERPPRPKSFAQDDLALPTPVPSLAHVLEEGRLLLNERQAWQAQAKSSLGNKRARSMSRTRAKSLTQKGRRVGHQPQSSMEFLAAQACLGNQNAVMTPLIAPPNLRIFNGADTTTPTTATNSSGSRGLHSHSNSLSKTISKTTKSHSRTHSRNDSWSKTASVRVARICGHPVDDVEFPIDPPVHRSAPDLENAIRGDGTRFIRLADPAHIPVDKGSATQLPIQHPHNLQYQRLTPSPAASGLSDSKVGIALGTPPEEEESSSYAMHHPYAQGYSFSNPARAPSDFAGPHPILHTATKAPTIPEIMARHKLPPQLAFHPYASTAREEKLSRRDSYLDANGLIGQFRSEEGTPQQSKMWAQLSPGVVREVLPGDFSYSPYMSESGHGDVEEDDKRQGRGRANTLSIHDTAGVAEALVTAARFRESKDSGLVVSEDHATVYPPLRHPQDEIKDLPLFARRGRAEVDRPVILKEAQKPSDPSTNHTIASSNLESSLSVPSERRQSISPALTSESSSPQLSPRHLGSPNDLENFQDLFYRPSPPNRQTPNEASLPDTPSPPNVAHIPWDVTMRNRRTGSGLTSLARQLSAEFHSLSQEHSHSMYSHSRSHSLSSSSQVPGGMSRMPSGSGSLQFVFEEMLPAGSPPRSFDVDSMEDSVHDYRHSGSLPEDVESSRASSLIENLGDDLEEEDTTAVLRVGVIESVSTPPAVASERRFSFNGETILDHDRHKTDHGLTHSARNHYSTKELRPIMGGHNDGLQSPISPQLEVTASPDSPDSHDRILSGLQPPWTEATRSSYMTTSTVSRMSNLSDFPAPPKDRPEDLRSSMTPSKHMSLLSSYFNDEFRLNEHLPLPPVPTGVTNTATHSLARPDSRLDVTFGDNQDARDVAKILSSHSESSSQS